MKVDPANFHLVDYFPDANYWEKNCQLFTSKNIIIKAASKDVAYPDHWGALSIKTVTRGYESYLVDQHEYRIDEYSYLILNHDQYYGSYIKQPFQVESLSFHFTKLFESAVFSYFHGSHGTLLDNPFYTEACPFPEFAVTLHRYTPLMRKLVLDMQFMLCNINTHYHAIEEGYYKLYMEILRTQAGIEQSKQQLAAIKKSTRDEIFRRVLLAKNYLEANYGNRDMSLSTLSVVACMNRYHLLRCFKQVYHVSPYQYLKQFRLEMAWHLLKEKKYSISEVVILCGYEDVSSFCKTFKNRFGVSPSRV